MADVSREGVAGMTRPKLPKTIAKERRRTAPRESKRLTGWCPLCKMTVHFGERVMYYPRESRMEHIKCQEAGL